MKSIILLAVLSAFLASPTVPASPPVSLAIAAPTVDGRPKKLPEPRTCDERYDNLVNQIGAAGKADFTRFSAALLTLGGGSVAEALAGEEAQAWRDQGSELIGTISMRRYKKTQDESLSFRMLRDDGILRLRWTFRGRTRTSPIDACESDMWTATVPGGTLSIHLPPPPPFH